MAKGFKEYTIEDLYRLNFSFLIQGIKNKELEDSSLSEEAFIIVQKRALMNIFTSLDAKQIDCSVQVIEPFLIGRRLETDLSKIQAIVETLSNVRTKDMRELNVELTDGLSSSYALMLNKVKVSSNTYESSIKSERELIAGYEGNIMSHNESVLSYSRKIYESRRRISELTVLLANEKLKGNVRLHPLTELIHSLQENNFNVIGIGSADNYSQAIVHVARICKLQMKDPENSRKLVSYPLLVFVNFRLSNSGITVSGHRSANRYGVGTPSSAYYHPHISESDSGSFCLGNTATLLSKISKEGAFNHIGDLVKIYADLMDTYNPDSPYRVLQEVFCNMVNIFIDARRNIAINEPAEFADMTGEEFARYAQIQAVAKHYAYRLRNNVNSAFDEEATKQVYLDYFKVFKDSISEEMIRIIENSNVHVNLPSCCFSTITANDSVGYYIKFLKLIGGFSNEESYEEESYEEESYEEESYEEESEDN